MNPEDLKRSRIDFSVTEALVRLQMQEDMSLFFTQEIPLKKTPTIGDLVDYKFGENVTIRCMVEEVKIETGSSWKMSYYLTPLAGEGQIIATLREIE